MALCKPAATELKIKERSRIARMQRSLFTDPFFDFRFDLYFDFRFDSDCTLAGQ